MHPGGSYIIPQGKEISDYTPIQYPANNIETDVVTTHFDNWSLFDSLFKFDILMHDTPSMLRNLEQLTGVNPETIPLDLTFENPTETPFPYIQEVSVAEYKILDSNNKEVIKTKLPAEDGDKGTVSDGKVLVDFLLNDSKFKSGEEYTIVIEKMYGLSKADAPLHITGAWECKFVK